MKELKLICILTSAIQTLSNSDATLFKAIKVTLEKYVKVPRILPFGEKLMELVIIPLLIDLIAVLEDHKTKSIR